MKNKLSIIILLQLSFLFACSTNKTGLSNSHLSSQKLATIQILKPGKESIKTGVENNQSLAQKTDINKIAPLHSTAIIPDSASPKQQPNKGLTVLKSLPETVKRELKNVSAGSSYIASVSSQPGGTKNPYVPPLITFSAIGILFTIIFGLTIYSIGPEVIGGIIFLLIMAIAVITFLILSRATKPENYGSSLTKSYFLAWLIGLIATAFPFLMVYYSIPLMIPSALLFVASVIFFLLWLKHLGENQVHDSSKPMRHRKIAYLVVALDALAAAWLISLISLSLPAPMLIYLLILFGLTVIFFFVLWLVKTYPRKAKIS